MSDSWLNRRNTGRAEATGDVESLSSGGICDCQCSNLMFLNRLLQRFSGSDTTKPLVSLNRFFWPNQQKDSRVPLAVREQIDSAGLRVRSASASLRTPLDEECDRAGLTHQKSDLVIGTAFGVLVLLIEFDPDLKPFRNWAAQNAAMRVRHSRAQSDASVGLVKSWAVEKKKGKDLPIITGKFVCDSVAELPGATPTLRQLCARIDNQASIGAAIVSAVTKTRLVGEQVVER